MISIYRSLILTKIVKIIYCLYYKNKNRTERHGNTKTKKADIFKKS